MVQSNFFFDGTSPKKMNFKRVLHILWCLRGVIWGRSDVILKYAYPKTQFVGCMVSLSLGVCGGMLGRFFRN